MNSAVPMEAATALARSRIGPPARRMRSSTPSRQSFLRAGQDSRRSPPATTTTWPSPTRCATACCIAGSAPPRPTPSTARAPSPTSRPSSSSARTWATTSSTSASTNEVARRRWRSWASTLDDLLEQRTSPGSATAASGGWPPASSTRWPRWRSPRSATASATSSASSSRRSSTAGRWRSTDKWLRFGNPWEIARPEMGRARSSSAATPRHYSDERRAAVACAGCRTRIVSGVALRHADPRLPRQHGEHAAAVARRGGRVVRLRGLQPRRLLRRGRAEGRRRRTSPRCSIPNDEADAGQGAAPGAAVLLRVAARCRTCSASIAQRRAVRLDAFHEKFAVQLNDTHPAIASPN